MKELPNGLELTDVVMKIDINDLCMLHYAAFEGSLNTLAGKKYLYSFFNWFIENSDTIFIVSKYKGKICGYALGAPIGYEKNINKDLFWVAFTGLVVRPWRLLNKKLILNIYKRLMIILGNSGVKTNVTDELSGKGISLVGIAVSKEFKGSSVASSLILAFEEKSKMLQFDFNRLSVHKENIRAQRFYEKSNWKKIEISNCIYYYKYN